jgi:riboflavin kinase/FMN adenylyltransferase
MHIATSIAELPALTRDEARQPSVVTIGNFDGVHRGHQMVIASVIDRARALNARACAVTFDPHPSHVLDTGPKRPLITPLAHKLDLLAATGLDLVLVLPFTDELRCWTAFQFAEAVLHNALHAIEVHEGETFRFGYQASADMHSLKALGRELGFGVLAYTPFVLRGGPVSSSRIRTLISAGDVSHARALLGRPFAIRGTPASGRGYGTRYTVPTINLAPPLSSFAAGGGSASSYELLPANGVYITTLTVGDVCFHAVTNVGNRPTFGTDSFTVESHLLNFHPIALAEDTPLELAFLHRLRDEIRFPSPEALLTQIKKDVRQAQHFFSLAAALKVGI